MSWRPFRSIKDILVGAAAAVGGGSAGSRASGAARLLSAGWALPAAAAAALLGAQEAQAAAGDEEENATEEEGGEEEEDAWGFNQTAALEQARQHTAGNKQKTQPQSAMALPQNLVKVRRPLVNSQQTRPSSPNIL